MVSRVSSLGLSPLRARGRTCAWSSRASGRISNRPTRAPRAGGSGSLRPWSRSWRGWPEALRKPRHRAVVARLIRGHSALEFEQARLRRKATAEPGEVTGRSDDPVAWRDDRDGVLAVRRPNRAARG